MVYLALTEIKNIQQINIRVIRVIIIKSDLSLLSHWSIMTIENLIYRFIQRLHAVKLLALEIYIALSL